MIQIGCVADDFTGASDWASFFARKGVEVVLYNGVPAEEPDSSVPQVAVIALKTRTAPLQEAVEQSRKALKWLERRGTKQYYIKYCSTFDCTKSGNIGPIADEAMKFLGVTRSVLCPALPVNKRTVKDGCLYVNGIPLQDSSMKNHPLTPMWDCRISELMKEQSRARIIPVSSSQYENLDQTRKWVEDCSRGTQPVYFVPDYYQEEHGESIVRLFGHWKLLTGGSGLCTYLADTIEKRPKQRMKGVPSPGAVIAGSCSKATLGQISYYLQQGKSAVKMDPGSLLDRSETVDTLWDKIKDCQGDVLIYSSQEPDQVRENQRKGKEKTAALIENVQAELAQRLLLAGRKRIIVAGGETSGAITGRLGYKAYRIGESVAPGVPVMAPVTDPGIRLVLKSGNFGQADFFIRALEMTKEVESNEF